MKLCGSLINYRDELKKNLFDLLTIENLKKNNKELIKDVYEEKNEEYKNEINYEKFCKNIDLYIYDYIVNNKNIIINHLLNVEFNFFIIETIKQGIKEQFEDSLEEIVSEIYSKAI